MPEQDISIIKDETTKTAWYHFKTSMHVIANNEITFSLIYSRELVNFIRCHKILQRILSLVL